MCSLIRQCRSTRGDNGHLQTNKKSGAQNLQPALCLHTQKEIFVARLVQNALGVISFCLFDSFSPKTSGVCPQMYSSGELVAMAMGSSLTSRSGGGHDLGDSAVDKFLTRVHQRTHVMLCVSEDGDDLRWLMDSVPGVVSNAALLHFSKWSHSELAEVRARLFACYPVSQHVGKGTWKEVFQSNRILMINSFQLVGHIIALLG